jgi:hypothetical protein
VLKKKNDKAVSQLHSYRVVWEIDVAAASPKKAAMEARECQEPGTSATTFDVYDEDGECTRVDLGVVD